MGNDTAYIERANGRWEAWTYADGRRLILGHSHTLGALIDKWRLRGFHIVRVNI